MAKEEKEKKKISKAVENTMKSFITLLGDAIPEIEPEDPLCKQLKELVASMNINPQFSHIAIAGIINLCEEDPVAMREDMQKVRDKLIEVLKDEIEE